LKAETGKGLMEHLIPDEEIRNAVFGKINERNNGGHYVGTVC